MDSVFHSDVPRGKPREPFGCQTLQIAPNADGSPRLVFHTEIEQPLQQIREEGASVFCQRIRALVEKVIEDIQGVDWHRVTEHEVGRRVSELIAMQRE